MLLGFRQSTGLFMTDNQVDQGEEGISGEGIIQMEKKKRFVLLLDICRKSCMLFFCFLFLLWTENSVNYVFMCVFCIYLA